MSNQDDLERLADLHQRGVLTDEAYEAARRRVMADLPTGPLLVGVDIPMKASRDVADEPAPAPAPRRDRRDRETASRRPVVVAAAAVVLLILAAFYVGAREWRQRSTARESVAAGDLALLHGDFAGALSHYRRAHQLWSDVRVHPERLAFADGGVAETAGLEALQAGDPMEAVARFGDAVTNYEAAEAGYRTSGEGDSVERAALAGRIVGAQASRSFALGLLSLRDGDTRAAVIHLERALEFESRPEIEAALGRARARLAFEDGQRLLREGDFAGAYERFRAAGELENLPEYVAAMEEAAGRISAGARSALEDGLEALRSGDYGRAADALSAIPRSAADAFDAAQQPLSEARRRLQQVLGRETATGPASTTDSPSTTSDAAEAAALYALHHVAAGEACRTAIEDALGLQSFEWTDGFLGRKFPDYVTPAKEPGVLTLAGEALLVRLPDGSWRPAPYACDFDTVSQTVRSVDVR